MEEDCRRGTGREEERMNRVKGEICYGGLGTRKISKDRKRSTREDLQAGHSQHLLYGECR